MEVIRESTVGNVVVDKHQTPRVGAIAVEVDEIGVVDGRKNENLIAEGFVVGCGWMVTVETFYGCQIAVIHVG